MRLFIVTAALQIAACGENDETQPSTSQENPVAEIEWTGTQISVLGTAEKPLPEGFTRIEANCIEWQDAPSVGPLVVQIAEG